MVEIELAFVDYYYLIQNIDCIFADRWRCNSCEKILLVKYAYFSKKNKLLCQKLILFYNFKFKNKK